METFTTAHFSGVSVSHFPLNRTFFCDVNRDLNPNLKKKKSPADLLKRRLLNCPTTAKDFELFKLIRDYDGLLSID